MSIFGRALPPQSGHVENGEVTHVSRQIRCLRQDRVQCVTVVGVATITLRAPSFVKQIEIAVPAKRKGHILSLLMVMVVGTTVLGGWGYIESDTGILDVLRW